MRDVVFLALCFVITFFAIKRALYAAMAYAWISIMVPHKLMWGFSADLPWAWYFGSILLLSLIISKEPRAHGNWGNYTPSLVFFAWTSVTLLGAFAPEAAYGRWDALLKMQLAMLMTLLVLSDRENITKLIWILSLSLAYYGVKGGIFTLVTGGHYRVYGPTGSMIQDNNHLAVGLLTVIPLLLWMREESRTWLIRYALAAMILLSGIAAIGTYSRGAMVAAIVGGAALLMRAQRRLPVIVGLAVLIPLVAYLMPDEYWLRIGTIAADNPDASVEGRFTAWSVAVNVANHLLLGGGFDYYRAPEIYLTYLSGPGEQRAAHSIYFQVLGDHGWIGLTLYAFMLAWFFRTLHRTRVIAKGCDQQRWAYSLAGYLQVSAVIIMAGGAFLSLAYWEFVYYLIALAGGLYGVVRSTPVNTTVAPAD